MMRISLLHPVTGNCSWYGSIALFDEITSNDALIRAIPPSNVRRARHQRAPPTECTDGWRPFVLLWGWNDQGWETARCEWWINGTGTTSREYLAGHGPVAVFERKFGIAGSANGCVAAASNI